MDIFSKFITIIINTFTLEELVLGTISILVQIFIAIGALWYAKRTNDYVNIQERNENTAFCNVDFEHVYFRRKNCLDNKKGLVQYRINPLTGDKVDLHWEAKHLLLNYSIFNLSSKVAISRCSIDWYFDKKPERFIEDFSEQPGAGRGIRVNPRSSFDGNVRIYKPKLVATILAALEYELTYRIFTDSLLEMGNELLRKIEKSESVGAYLGVEIDNFIRLFGKENYKIGEAYQPSGISFTFNMLTKPEIKGGNKFLYRYEQEYYLTFIGFPRIDFQIRVIPNVLKE